MRQGVVGEIAARQDRVDQRETGGGAVAHRDGRGAIELDDRRGIRADEDVVEAGDLPPVGPVRRRRLGVDRRDRRLQRVRPEAPRRQRALDQRRSLGDLRAVPQRAILLVQQDDLAVRGRAPGAARLVQEHQRQQAHRLRLRQELDDQPPEPNRLGRQVVARQRLPGRGRIPLGEHQVDHVQDAVEPIRQIGARRHLIGNPRVADLPLGADDPLGDGRRAC